MKTVIREIQNKHIYPEEVLELLRGNDKLTSFQKNCIWTYCFPTNIGDYELPGLIQEERGSNTLGWLKPEESEILLLLRAYSCGQYSGYMKHLLWAFTRNPESIKIPGEGEEEECGVCGKKLYPWNTWEERGGDETKETLAFASTKSSQCMCLDCQVQMNALWNLLQEMGVE